MSFRGKPEASDPKLVTTTTTQHRKGDMPVRKPDEGERQQLKTKNQRKCNSEGNLWNQWKKYL